VDTCILEGNEIELNAFGGDTYEWEESEFILSGINTANPLIAPIDSFWFFVNIIDENDCSTNDSVFVAVLDNVLDGIKPVNTITPNGDGLNDV